MATHPASPTAGSGSGDRSPSGPPPVRLSAAQAVAAIQPTSPRYFFSSLAAASAAASSPHRRIGIAVDLSDESAFAVKWAVQNYLRPGDAVVLLHVRPTSVLYGADWGSIPVSVDDDPDADIAEGAARAAASEEEPEEAKKKREEDFDAFTSTKAQDLAQPLVVAQTPFKIHIVKDHDMKERLCLEAERLGLSALIMGSRGFGASRRAGKGRLGSVSDYCVHHCVCPVVVVRYPDDAAGAAGGDAFGDELRPVPENEPVYHEAPEAQKGLASPEILSWSCGSAPPAQCHRHAKWLDLQSKSAEGNEAASGGPPLERTEGLQAEDEGSESLNRPLKRPMGRDRAKTAKRSSSGASGCQSSSEYSNLFWDMHIQRMNWWEKVEGDMANKIGQLVTIQEEAMKFKQEMNARILELKKEKQEMMRLKEDERIMAIDLSACNPGQRALYEALQAQILARRTNQSG